MSPDKQMQVEKLARTLLKSGLSSSYPDALSKARSMLKIPEPAAGLPESPDPSALPKVDDIIPISLGADFDRDASLKEAVDEEGRRIYSRESQKKES